MKLFTAKLMTTKLRSTDVQFALNKQALNYEQLYRWRQFCVLMNNHHELSIVARLNSQGTTDQSTDICNGQKVNN